MRHLHSMQHWRSAQQWLLVLNNVSSSLPNALRYRLPQTPCRRFPQISRKMHCRTCLYKPCVGFTNRTFIVPTNRMQNAPRHRLLKYSTPRRVKTTMARCCKLCPMGNHIGPTTRYFHAPLHIRAHVLLFSLLLYIVMECALASFQTQVTERPSDPQPLTKPEGRERCRRQGDGTVNVRATELPLLLTFLDPQARCHGSGLPPQRRAAPPKSGQTPARGVPRAWHRGLAGRFLFFLHGAGQQW